MTDTATQAEAAFEALSEWLAKELSAVRGSPSESAVLEEAVRRYAKIRRTLEPAAAFERAAEFFLTDGVALATARTPAVDRVEGVSDAERKAWRDCLAEHALRLADADAPKG